MQSIPELLGALFAIVAAHQDVDYLKLESERLYELKSVQGIVLPV